jgi:hypothetical protein
VGGVDPLVQGVEVSHAVTVTLEEEEKGKKWM